LTVSLFGRRGKVKIIIIRVDNVLKLWIVQLLFANTSRITSIIIFFLIKKLIKKVLLIGKSA